MKCHICKKEMTEKENCGGDCVKCMAEAGDPECIAKTAIKTLILRFPEGISMREAQAISMKAEVITMFGCSEGGFKMLTNPLFMSDDEPLVFSDHTAEFVHSYRRKPE